MSAYGLLDELDVEGLEGADGFDRRRLVPGAVGVEAQLHVCADDFADGTDALHFGGDPSPCPLPVDGEGVAGSMPTFSFTVPKPDAVAAECGRCGFFGAAVGDGGVDEDAGNAGVSRVAA